MVKLVPYTQFRVQDLIIYAQIEAGIPALGVLHRQQGYMSSCVPDGRCQQNDLSHHTMELKAFG
jgi:hypothetical protein